METEKHFVKVNDNEEIAVVHHKASTDKWIFLCHGFGGNKDRGNKKRAEVFAENGWNAVRLDFRGNGESDGEFIEQGLSSRIKDLKTVIDYFNPDNFVFFGTSFGGKVVFHTAVETNAMGVIGKAPVTYNKIMSKFESVIEEKGRFEYIDGKPIDNRFIEDLYTHDFSEVEEKLDVPVFISHGGADQTVHFENTAEASKKLDADLQVQKLEGVKHSYTDEGKEKMNTAILNWLERF